MLNLTRFERLLAEAGIIALCGCIVAVLGLFTPPEMPLGARLAYWIFGLLAAWALVQILANVGGAVAKLIGLAPQWGYAFTIPLATVGITWAVLYSTGGSELALSDAFARVWPAAMLIGAGFFALFFALYARAGSASEPEVSDTHEDRETPPEQTHTALHDRLPPGFPEIIALSVEDHYTRVHASERSEMVLMPLSEAIGLMPVETGRQVHRSWWVARSATHSHKREGRDIKLTLVNGLEVPVSRAQTKALREEGWLG